MQLVTSIFLSGNTYITFVVSIVYQKVKEEGKKRGRNARTTPNGSIGVDYRIFFPFFKRTDIPRRSI